MQKDNHIIEPDIKTEDGSQINKSKKSNINNKKSENVEIDGTTGEELKPVEDEKSEVDTVMQTNKMMSWMMPIMSISIAFVAPLGLALYWLINNILMIIERLVLDKVIKN